MGNGISSRMGIGSSRVRSRVRTEEDCRTTINNHDMILMLDELTSQYVTIKHNNNGEKVSIIINWQVFKNKVNDLIEELSQNIKNKNRKLNVRDQMSHIKDCLKSEMNEFTIEHSRTDDASNMISFDIVIRGYSTGGRRSKTYCTKKGKRKGTKRRGYRRF